MKNNTFTALLNAATMRLQEEPKVFNSQMLMIHQMYMPSIKRRRKIIPHERFECANRNVKHFSVLFADRTNKRVRNKTFTAVRKKNANITEKKDNKF
jgi:hypothetical protein